MVGELQRIMSDEKNNEKMIEAVNRAIEYTETRLANLRQKDDEVAELYGVWLKELVERKRQLEGGPSDSQDDSEGENPDIAETSQRRPPPAKRRRKREQAPAA